MKRKIVTKLMAIVLAGVLLTGSVTPGFHMSRVQAAEDLFNTRYDFNFEDGIEGWYYGEGWEYQYNGAKPTLESDTENGRMKIAVDFSQDADKNWSNIAACWKSEEGIDLSGVTQISMDIWYETEKLTEGELKLAFYSNCGIDVNTSLIDVQEEEGTGLTKARAVFGFPAIGSDAVTDLAVKIVGCNTGYSGAVWIDNIQFEAKDSETGDESEQPDTSVDSTLAANSGNPVSSNGSALTVVKKDGTSESGEYASSVSITDPSATGETVALYQYLQAMGKTDSIIYGHQNDTWHKAGSAELSNSDTYDVTGAYAGIVGMDTLSVTGNEYSAEKYNSEMAGKPGFEAVDTQGQSIEEANVEAAAKLANYNIANGSVITLSSHTPNFSLVKENPNYDPQTDPSYAKYDFSVYTPNTLTGDTMNQILPGGKYNEIFNAYLDMIADFAGRVDGPVMFRPFHEATGSWFWWGAAFCDAETYKSVYKYTVEYLRDKKEVHNFLYLYGPGSEAVSEEEYGIRYPGDEYVDVIGFDMYDMDPVDDKEEVWFGNLRKQLEIVQNFADEHGKLMAVTETGLACSSADPGHNQTVLHETGNKNLNWYNMVLDVVSESNASYFLLWANFGKKDGYYTPYVDSVNNDGTLHGHETLDGFISFFNDNRSIFASDQKNILANINAPEVQSPAKGVYGYITAPVAGSRILEPTQLTAQVNGSSENSQITFVLKGETEQTITAELKDGTAVAQLTAETLKSLGESAEGTLELTADGQVIASIGVLYNIAIPEEDPYGIDGFENYYGVDSMLTNYWAVNKDTGCTINLALTAEKGQVFDGKYAMKFVYNETSNGWAGATISKEVNWSDCDALQFYTIPDGKHQKVVIQLTANGKVYETYLNEYEAYAENDGTVPIKVTIPFTDFVERDTQGNPAGGLAQDKTSITSFGLWVNAIPGTDAIGDDGMVTGTIIYDKITAVSSGVTEAIFEKAESGDSEVENPQTEDPEANSDENGSQEQNSTSAAGQDNGKHIDKTKPIQTGDDINYIPYAAALFVAGIAALGAVIYRKKKKHG